MSVLDYLNKLKSITDQLDMVGCEIQKKEKVQQALGRLELEFHVLSTTLSLLSALPTFDEITSKLLHYELSLNSLKDLSKGVGSSSDVLNTAAGQGRGHGIF
jgi:hypothetical protein